MWAHMARRYAWVHLGRCVLVLVCPRDGAQEGDLYTGVLVRSLGVRACAQRSVPVCLDVHTCVSSAGVHV